MVAHRIYMLFPLMALIGAADAQAPAETSTVIRSESRLVLVDAVVTDKKGNYVHDLAKKDFKVWEDGKEQNLTSFSLESETNPSGKAQKRYLILFFDNSTSSMADQIQARAAASKFIDSNAGPNRPMAVVDYSGALRVSQNFTEDADRLKKVVSGAKFSSLGPASEAGGVSLGGAFASFSSRNVLLALRDMAKRLSTVPGRKTLIFISAGFPLDKDNLSDLTTTIDVCNRSNVAVYPIDVRGLVAGAPMGPRGSLVHPVEGWRLAMANVHAALDSSTLMQPAFFQKGGPVGGTGGTAGGGRVGSPAGGTSTGGKGTAAPSSGGASSGGGSNNSAINTANRNPMTNPNNPMRQIVPPTVDGASRNQQVLYALASGTGGFVILNTNDLLGGLEKIGKEQNEYYLVGYTPSKELEPGACHSLKVKVDRGGSNVRARTGYCDVKPLDVLSGTSTERDLENRSKAGASPTVKASMLAPFFYTSPDTARVNVAMELPAGAIAFAKEKGKLHSAMNIIGVVSNAEGAVAARFSDTVKMDFEDKKQAEAFQGKPFHYEKQFEVASGNYMLKVVFSSGGENFGKLDLPLVVDPYDSKRFAVSALALSRNARSAANGASLSVDSVLLEDRVPLITNGIEITPSGSNRFSSTDKGFIYAEIYEPSLLAADQPATPPALAVQIQIVDQSGAVKKDSGVGRVEVKSPPGNPAVPIGMRLDVAGLTSGPYSVRVTAFDATGNQAMRTAKIEIN